MPDYTAEWIGKNCPSAQDCPTVTLGNGGSITLQFIDNRLTGSGDSQPDLWIFEVGPDVEDQFVEVSTDGQTWSPVGKVGSSTAGVDIDAVGAISTVRLQTVPEPAPLALAVAAALAACAVRRRRNAG